MSTLTTLLAFSHYGRLEAIRIVVKNLDQTATVTVLIEESTDGELTDDDFAVLVVPPRKQKHLVMSGPEQVARWYRISAHTDAPSYPVALVQFQILGTRPRP